MLLLAAALVVRVVEAKPSLTTVTIASNADDTTLAKQGSEVTLTVVASEDLKAPGLVCAFKADGTALAGEVAVSGSAKNWACKVTVGADDADADITYTINFKNAADEDGDEVTAPTNNKKVTIDNTKPELKANSLSYESDNGVKTLATTGDKITIKFETSEAVGTPTCAKANVKSGGTVVGNDPAVTEQSGSSDKKKWQTQRALKTKGSPQTLGTLSFRKGCSLKDNLIFELFLNRGVLLRN